MDWWPTFGKLAGLEAPPHDWEDNDGKPIIFDGIDLSDSLLGTGPGKRDYFIYFNDQSFGGIRVKNYKTLYTAKDTWLGQDQNLKIPALYDLGSGEPYDIVFNGAAPTRGDFKSSPGRYSGQDNGWIGVYITPVQTQFWSAAHPNIPISRSAPALTRISRRNSGRARRRPKQYCEGGPNGAALIFSAGSRRVRDFARTARLATAATKCPPSGCGSKGRSSVRSRPKVGAYIGLTVQICRQIEQILAVVGAKPAKSLTCVAGLLYPSGIIRLTLSMACESVFCGATLQLRDGWCSVVHIQRRQRAIGTENEA
jgi:hypothetical protein